MSIKTWVTQPAHVFDSFYYYDTVNLNFVRIRLELGRTDPPPYDPNPGVFPEQNRYVGFVEDLNKYDFDNSDLWTVNAAHAIVYKAKTIEEEVLSRQPAPGKSTVDFTLPAGHVHPAPESVHYGNPIVDKNLARLPLNRHGEPVTLEMLQTIAEKVAHLSEVIDLGDSTETEQQLGDKIFQLYAILIGSTEKKNTKSFALQIQEANEFFNDKSLPAFADNDNPYADKDGLIEFIIGTELLDNPKVMEKLATLKKYLISLTSVVTDYVNRYAAANGEQYKTDAELWAKAMSMLPLMGPGKIDTQSYSRHIKGVTIATEFVQFLLDIITKDGTAALNRFQDFLKKQGDALKFGVESNKDFYNTITIGISIEVLKISKDNIMFVPKIKQYKVKFDRTNSKWSGACVSYEYVDINFDYLYAANVFDYEALDNKKTREEFEKFIQGSQKAQIDKATTFFNDDFTPKKSSLATKIVR